MVQDAVRMVAAMDRLGTESAFEVLARAQKLAAEGRNIINLGIGQPDFRTPDFIVEAAVRALRDGAHGYTPANGLPDLRAAVAADLEKRHGAPVDPDAVLIVPGGKVTMFFATLMFGEPGTEILYPNPGFPIYESVINFTGATAVPVPLLEANGFAFDPDDILSRITPRTRLIILNSPANPTGGVAKRTDFDRLVQGLEAHPHVAVMSDEIYSQMLYDGQEHVSMLQYESMRDRLILLDGWSKTYAMTGWRMGFSVWPRRLIEPATRLAINCHSCVNAASQYAGLAALTGPQDEVSAMVAAFAERRKLVIALLNELPDFSCVSPGGAFYAFPNISGTGLPSATIEKCPSGGSRRRDDRWNEFGSFGEGYIRISYANSTENISQAIENIRQWLERKTPA